MNFRPFFLFVFFVASCFCQIVEAQPVSDTAFTYQGELQQNGIEVSQQCDFEFSLWTGNNAPDPGVQVGPDVEASIQVNEGIFTADLDFGANALAGAARWLNIAVCCATPCAPAYTELAPRQMISSSPFSVQTRGIFVDENKNVGIGTTSPNSLLSVGVGNDAMMQLGMSPQLFFSKDVANTKFRMQLAGSGYGGYDLQIGRDDQGHAIGLSGNVEVSGDLGVFDNLNVTGDLGASGVGLFANRVGIGALPDLETMLHVNTASDDYGVLAEAANQAGSRIGLHVNSAGFSSLAKNAYFSGSWNRFDTGKGAFLQEVDPDGDTSLSAAPPGAGAINWNRAMVIKTNGRVGMGTNNPAVKLHVDGNQRIDGNQTVFGNIVTTGSVAMGYEIVEVVCNDTFCIAPCPAGKKVMGGGCGNLSNEVVTSTPQPGGTGWVCEVSGGDGTNVKAICANID